MADGARNWQCRSLTKCQHCRWVVLILTLGLATGARAKEEVWAVQLGREHVKEAPRVAEELGMEVVGRLFDNVFLLRGENLRAKRGRGEGGLVHPMLEWAERQMGRRRTPRYEKDIDEQTKHGSVEESETKEDRPRTKRNVGGLDFRSPKSPWDLLKTQDPLRWRQWYLGTGEGMCLNVTQLWSQGIRGGGVSVAILDDGVELTHLDLALNYDPAASWDLLDADPDPTPVPWSRHGTQLAGIVAATHNNGLCGMGMAPWTGVGAVRMLGHVVWDAVEAAALSYERDHVDVYLAAWGPVDTGAVMEGPGGLADRAMRESIVLGRNGRGSIYVWASGNGGFVGDDCNADGYANSVFTLTVSGSTRDGRPPDYAETCAATFVSTYSGDADPEYQPGEQVTGIVTTDTGSECTESFRGSSVSAAMVAGACALALDANPELGWRDMQHLMVHSATPHNPLPEHWKTNGVGRNYSHYFGFGSLDAGKMVDLGRQWKPVPPAFRCHAHATHRNITLVPDEVLLLPLTVSGCQIVETEHVQVNVTISTDNRGQIEIDLESPLGTTSKLLPKRPLDVSPYGINKHPFLSVHMWGENPVGTWKLRILYHKSNILEQFGKKLFVDIPNMMLNWSLIIHGTEVPHAEATPHHFHYNKTQLEEALRARRPSQRPLDGRRQRGNSGRRETSPEIQTDYWVSQDFKGGEPHTYLFCRVMTSSPTRVTSITWHSANGEAPSDVIKRLTGRGPWGDKYPALLLVRETATFKGNFTCRVVFDGKEFSRSLDIRSNLSSVPMAMETTQVALEGTGISLPCHGLLPIVRGTWMKNGTRLTTSGRISIAEDHLFIRDVQEDDTGVYECHTHAPVLHYNHTALVTLLLANGTSTLITHYAITTQPRPTVLPMPPLCVRPQEELEEEEEKGPPNCPAPYALVGNHCLTVLEGEGKTWHRSRVQCHRLRGDLVKVHDAAFMLALIQFLRVKGFSTSSFWAGGLRTGAKAWTWVDGTSVDLKEPHWFLGTTDLPKDIPLSRTSEAPLRKVGIKRPTILSLGERVGPPLRAGVKGGRPRSRIGTKRRRRRPKKNPRKRRTRSLGDDVTVNDDVDDDVTGNNGTHDDVIVNNGVDDDVIVSNGTDDDVIVNNGVDDDVTVEDYEDEDEEMNYEDLNYDDDDEDEDDEDDESSEYDDDSYYDIDSEDPANYDIMTGEVSEYDTDSTEETSYYDSDVTAWETPSGEDLRDQRGASIHLLRQRASSTNVMALPNQRAACLWADFGHFLASCSVLHDLHAICEYTPEEEE